MEILGSFRSFRKGAGVNLWHETCHSFTQQEHAQQL